MKKFMISTSLVLAMAAPVMAADANSMFRTDAGPADFRASEFIGKRIYQTETETVADAIDGVQDGWSDIGEVNDVVLSRDGDTEAVLVDIGGFLGIGENQVAVDMDALTFVRNGDDANNMDGYFLVLNTPAAALETAPTYETSGLGSSDSLSNEPLSDGSYNTATATDPNAPTLREKADDLANSAAATASNAANSIADGAQSAMDEVTGAFDAERTAETDPVASMPATNDSAEALAAAGITLSDLDGATALDANDEVVGEISDVVLSQNGELDAVIVDVGGFLGIGEKPVQLSMDDVMIDNQDGSVRIYSMMTREQIEEMPSYEVN